MTEEEKVINYNTVSRAKTELNNERGREGHYLQHSLSSPGGLWGGDLVGHLAEHGGVVVDVADGDADTGCGVAGPGAPSVWRHQQELERRVLLSVEHTETSTQMSSK